MNNKGLLSVIEYQAINHPNQIAIKRAGKSTTYSRFRKDILHWAELLRLETNDVKYVVVSLEDTCLFITIFSALISLNKTVIAADPFYKLNSYQDIIKDRFLFLDKNRLQQLHQSKATISSQTNFEAGALGLFTSGTTGEKKLVLQSQDSLLYSIKNSPICLCKRNYPKRVLSYLPHYHLAGFYSSFLMPFLTNGTLFLENVNFSPLNILKQIHQFKITDIIIVPSVLRILARLDKPLIYKHEIVLWLGGDKISIADLEIAKMIFPKAKIFNCYAMTEAARITCLNVNKFPKKIESVGKPPKGVIIKIKNPNKFGIGEVLVKGPSVMTGYYHKNNYPIKKWLHTGDLGYLDKQKFLYLVGRKKNLIKYCGFSIIPEAIEKIIVQFDGISNCVIVGCEHPTLGQYPVAAVVTYKKDLDEKKILSFCIDKMKTYEIPKRILFFKSLPVSNTKKILRPKTLEMVLAKLAKEIQSNGKN